MKFYGDHRIRALLWVAAGAAVVVGVGVMLAGGEAAATVSGAVRAASGAHWAVVPVVAALVVVHFWFSAVALRGAAGRTMPLLHATLAQFTGATANRITGGGLGTVAVNARYLTGRGMPAGRSVAVAGVLQVGGAIADLLLFAVVVAVAVAAGDGALLSHVHVVSREVLVIGAVAVVAAGVAAWLLRARLRGPIEVCAEMARRPRDLLVMMAASAATTLVMGVAFAVSMLAVPGAVSPGQIGTLIVVYMIGAAAGGVVPGPGGLGSTEAALVALLAVAGVETAAALSGVLIFRAITHWAPVPVGVLAAGTVRGRKAATVVALPAREKQDAPVMAQAA
ncbi:lysylphosphatidylglycerol synthase domain-containing protein [Actinomadura rugatobispora]|uniref:Lysylphosphatidylglycerol synthase domain-containing protein n=1 Tax=Actinomadura rugatobispora TaxID=1994 RepID=A0ABW1A209_9ACTN|nr:lysylphosphatidylglycerol synthase domain-containing protein [Actinomadura rugatobispora]